MFTGSIIKVNVELAGKRIIFFIDSLKIKKKLQINEINANEGCLKGVINIYDRRLV